jgi:hypothetical protein
MRRQLVTTLLIVLFLAIESSARAQTLSQVWKPLFNGKDLSGWKTDPKQPGHWRVENGILVGTGDEVSHLFSERGDFEGFHLRVEARINAKGNSGVFFRSEYGLNLRDTYPLGYEAQIDPGGSDPQLTGSLYGIVPVHERLIQPDQWFTLEVIGDGRYITIKVDGKKTVEFKDEKNTYRKGHFALQHSRGTTVAFRKIEVREPSAADLAKKYHKPWAVILCKFSDLPRYEPHPVHFYKEAFTEAGTGKGREFDYFWQISQGRLDMTGSKVFGWFDMPNHSTKDLSTLKYPFDRHILHDWGVEVARANHIDLSPFCAVLVIFNSSTDSGGAGGPRVVIGYAKNEWESTFNVHELGHGFGLDHTWFARPDIEYGDQWDIMGSGFTFKNRNSDRNGSGMNACNLRKLGCIPDDRVFESSGEAGSRTITLTALNQPGVNSHYLMASIPPAPGSGSETSYLVEFRRKKGWDAGIPVDTVLVHEVRSNGVCYLLSRSDSREPAAIQVLPGQEFKIAERNLTIKALSFDAAASTAKVSITIGK